MTIKIQPGAVVAEVSLWVYPLPRVSHYVTCGQILIY